MQIYFWIFPILLFIVIGVIKILREQNSKPHYKKEQNLLNNTELNFFRFLINKIPPNILVMCKVRLADIVSPVEKGRNKYKAFNKIKSKHIDFVLIDKTTSEIKVLIELNGKSHLRAKRIERDLFIKEVFTEAQIPIFFVNVKFQYSSEDIKCVLDSINIGI